MKKSVLFAALAVALFRIAAASQTIDLTKGRPKNVVTVKMTQPTWSATGLTGSGRGGRVICTRLDLDADRIDRIDLHTGGGLERASL